MINEQDQTYLKGQFLIAMPVLTDPIFYQTVTCISEHTSQGAVGVIVNRTNPELTAKDIFDELKIEYKPKMGILPIHIGGPVHMDEIFILHGPPFNWEGSFEVTTGLESFEPVRKALVDAGLDVDNASLQWIAKNTTPVSGDTTEKVIKLIDMLEDSDNIQNVYTNADFQDE